VVVAVVLVCGGCCGPALTGALTSRLDGIVAPDRLSRAYGADSATYNVSGIAGPALAATVAVAWGAVAATLVLAASGVIGAAVIAVTPLDRDRRGNSKPVPGWIGGVRAMTADPVLATVTVASSVGQIGPGALPVVVAVLCASEGSASSAGWLLTAVAVGALLGSLWWTARPAQSERTALVSMLSMVGVGLPLALAATAVHSTAAVAVWFVVGGFFRGPSAGALFTARHEHAPPDAQAQVFALGAGLKTTATAAGSALAGTMSGLPPASQLVLVGGSTAAAGVLGSLWLARPPRTRRAFPAGRQPAPTHARDARRGSR
jgi:predicted MFS family arabinose efflux permease